MALNKAVSIFKQEIFKGKHFQLGYFIKNGSDNLLILFPGFGQSARHYAYLAQNLKSEFSILAIDHFQHGDSQVYTKNEAISIEQFNATLLELIEFLGFKNSQIVFGGFSFGNWLAAAIIPNKELNSIGWLIMSAPPIRFSRLFKFATGNLIGKMVFKFYTHHFNGLSFSLNLLKKLHILSEDKIKMASLQAQNSFKTERLYSNWNAMRHFVPNWPNCIKMAQNKGIECLFIGGLNDKITPVKSLKQLFEREKNTRFLLFDGGHTFANEDVINGIDRFLAEIDKKQKFA